MPSDGAPAGDEPGSVEAGGDDSLRVLIATEKSKVLDRVVESVHGSILEGGLQVKNVELRGVMMVTILGLPSS